MLYAMTKDMYFYLMKNKDHFIFMYYWIDWSKFPWPARILHPKKLCHWRAYLWSHYVFATYHVTVNTCLLLTFIMLGLWGSGLCTACRSCSFVLAAHVPGLVPQGVQATARAQRRLPRHCGWWHHRRKWYPRNSCGHWAGQHGSTSQDGPRKVYNYFKFPQDATHAFHCCRVLCMVWCCWYIFSKTEGWVWRFHRSPSVV